MKNTQDAKPAIKNVEEIDREIEALQQELEHVEGTKTEVYTRIVGYYRSVANWNKGKREEYNYRKLYSEPSDMLKQEQPVTVSVEAAADVASYTFFYRQTCPNCPPVKSFIDSLPVPGNALDVDTTEGTEKAMEHQVMAAPTVIFFDSRGMEVDRAHNTKSLETIFADTPVTV